MLIFLAAIAVAFGLRRVLPERTHASVRLRWPFLPLVALLLQVVLGIGWLRHAVGGERFALVVVSYAIVGAWLIVNTTLQVPALRAPAGVIAAGWLLNTIPIVLNRGMPVSTSALTRIGMRLSSVSDGNLWKHVPAGPSTVLPWLGDVIPVPVPVFRNVVSLGDLVMMVGAMLAVQVVGLTGRLEHPRPEHALVLEAHSPP